MRTGRRPRVHIITMGCAKNVVDSEKLMAQLRASAIEVAPTLEGADVAVINTCGFIGAAREESVDMIVAQVRAKGRGRLKKVYAMGCLAERYRAELEKEIPEVDRFFGTQQLPDILRELGGRYRRELLGERVLTTPPHVAYLKVSEGCDNPCSFCSIPLMRGRHVSRPPAEIEEEARGLAAGGVRELVVIGQDTTFYGVDIDGSRRLAGVLERLAGIDGIEWVRLMYAYPAKFPLDVLDVIARHPRVCKYLDIPIQHAADGLLRSMRRGVTQRALLELLDAARERVPGIALRTTVIVGYPGEGPREFDELLRFVRRVRFDRLGVFAYSQEEGTPAFDLGDPVPAEEKERRRALIMEAQQEISLERNEALVGSVRRVIIDGAEGDRYAGRTEHDAPEVDNEVVVASARPLEPGTFCDVDIVEAYEYDLVGNAR